MNKKHEKALETELERFVQGKAISGKTGLDALRVTIPEADAAFVDNLEDRLLAQLSDKPSKKELAMMKRKEKPNVWRYPLTMAAAVLAIAILGGLAIFFNQEKSMTAANQVAVPTEIPFTTVVIAIEDIPAGVAITPDMVSLIRFPVESAPAGAMTDLEDVIGYATATIIYREEIVLSRKLIPATANELIGILPEPIGCISDAALITHPNNGALINSPTVMSGMTNISDFSQAKVEIAGPSTRNQYVVIATMQSAISTDSSFGEFVPSNYEDGVYRLRLTSFNRSAELVAACEIFIVISDASANTPAQIMNPVQVVVAASDLPVGTIIQPEMLEFRTFTPERGFNREASFDTIDELVGRMVVHDISTGATIFDFMLETSTSDLQAVVIALQDIPMNVRITEEMVAQVYWSQDTAMAMAEENRGNWYLGNVNDVIGMGSSQLIEANSPIYSAMLHEADSCTGRALDTDVCSQRIPSDKVGIILTTTDTSVANYINGQYVDIITSMLFVDVDEQFQELATSNLDRQRMVMSRTIENALVTYTEILHPNGQEEAIISLVLSSQDADVLSDLLEADVPYMIVPHNEGNYPSIPQTRDLTQGSNLVEIYLPQSSVDSVAYGLVQGDIVTIHAAGESFTGTAMVFGQHLSVGNPNIPDVYPRTLEARERVVGVVMESNEAQVLKRLVEQGEAIQFELVSAVDNRTEITAYYPVPENFIGDYDALTTDGRGLFIAIMPSNTPDSAVAGIPLYTLSNGQRVLVFEVTTQVGTYTRNREDGTVETGRSARLLLTNTEASWLKQLSLANIHYRYTLLPSPALEHPLARNLEDFVSDYPVSENGLALISIPTSQLSEIPSGLVSDMAVTIEIRPERQTANTTPENPDFVIEDSHISLENTARVVYIGNDTSAMPAPRSHYAEGESFVTLEISSEDAWFIDLYLSDGAVISLLLTSSIENSDTLANSPVAISVEGIGELNDEAIVIRNSSSEMLDLRGWVLSDSDGNEYEFQSLLFANAELRVYTKRGNDTPIDAFWNLDAVIWQSHETLILTDGQGQVQAIYEIP